MKMAVGLDIQPKSLAIIRKDQKAWLQSFQQEGLLNHLPRWMQEAMIKMLEPCDKDRPFISEILPKNQLEIEFSFKFLRKVFKSFFK